MDNNNFNGYFLYYGKKKPKLNVYNEAKSIKKVDIWDGLFVFYLKSSKSVGNFYPTDLRLQFFTWTSMKKVAIDLSQKNWTIHINVDDTILQEKIEEFRSEYSIADTKFWDEVANMIIKNSLQWPTRIVVEPSTLVRLFFNPPFGEENIEIRYGEIIYLHDTLFNDELKNLKVFLEAYIASIKKELVA